ncbi:hypothetical protein BJY52DRAFT_450073 [Lactarius psammicola]|nr:hypothetical protein BJY52DRAFT_450073 [Lactarius psammicola]
MCLFTDTNAVPPSFPVCYYATRNFMCQQALGLKMVFNRPVPVDHLESAIADSASLHRVQLLPLPLLPPFPRCIRGPSEYAGIRPASEYLTVSIDAYSQSVPRPTSRSTSSPSRIHPCTLLSIRYKYVYARGAP